MVEVPLLVEEEEVGLVLFLVQEVVEVEQEQVQEELQEFRQQVRCHHTCSRCSGSRSCAFCTPPSARRPCSSACGGTCADSGLVTDARSRLSTP